MIFYLFATDNTGVFETRLEAQAQAKGDTFLPFPSHQARERRIKYTCARF